MSAGVRQVRHRPRDLNHTQQRVLLRCCSNNSGTDHHALAPDQMRESVYLQNELIANRGQKVDFRFC
jgi:hypothetical protein